MAKRSTPAARTCRSAKPRRTKVKPVRPGSFKIPHVKSACDLGLKAPPLTAPPLTDGGTPLRVQTRQDEMTRGVRRWFFGGAALLVIALIFSFLFQEIVARQVADLPPEDASKRLFCLVARFAAFVRSADDTYQVIANCPAD